MPKWLRISPNDTDDILGSVYGSVRFNSAWPVWPQVLRDP